jgi:hypothetical protein
MTFFGSEHTQVTIQSEGNEISDSYVTVVLPILLPILRKKCKSVQKILKFFVSDHTQVTIQSEGNEISDSYAAPLLRECAGSGLRSDMFMD